MADTNIGGDYTKDAAPPAPPQVANMDLDSRPADQPNAGTQSSQPAGEPSAPGRSHGLEFDAAPAPEHGLGGGGGGSQPAGQPTYNRPPGLDFDPHEGSGGR